MTTNVFCSI